MRHLLLLTLAASLVGACATTQHPATPEARWIQFDRATQRYSVAASTVPRGQLLDQLKSISYVNVRPQPGREQPVTATAHDLTLDELIVLLLPAGTHYQLGLGDRDRDIGVRTPQKEGSAESRDPTLKLKRQAASEMIREGTLKERPQEYVPQKGPPGPRSKRTAEELIAVSATNAPRIPKPSNLSRNIVRLTLTFQEGVAPQVSAAQAIEGTPTSLRVVTGSYLYVALGADGRPVQYGTFQDPLIQHSYLPEGPHDLKRASFGVAGISVARENLQAGTVMVIDIANLDLPRELNDDIVNGILKRRKPLAQFEGRAALRLLDQKAK
jgi:hypothetical protein